MNLSTHRNDIDALRGLAITLGIFYHLDLNFVSGGFVALDIFLVISGYLISAQIIKRLKDQSNFSFSAFYANRVRRLFPALFVFILFCTFLFGIFFVGNPKTTEHFIEQVRHSLFAIVNIFFKNNTQGYFEVSSNKMPLLNVWSLSLEEQFYLCWPLMLWVTFKYTSEKINLILRLRILILAMIVASFIATLWAQKNGMISDAFFLVHFRAWEFGVGAMLATINIKQVSDSVQSLKANIVGTMGLLAIFLPVYFYTSAILFPGISALPSVLGTVLIIVAGSWSEKNYATRALKNPLLVHIGKISYSMFLWHWALLSFATIYFLERPQEWPIKLAILAISILFAELSFYFVEQPFRQKIYFKNASNYQVILSGVILSTVLALASGLITVRESAKMAPHMPFYTFLNERSALVSNCFDKIENVGSAKCTRRSPKAQENESLPRIVFWGDSHAYARFPMIESFADTHMIETTMYSFSSTPPLLGPYPEEFKRFEMYSQKVFDDIKARAQDKSSKLSVILTCNWTQGFPNKIFLISKDSDICYWGEHLNRSQCLDIFAQSLTQILDELNKVGVHKILVSLPPVEFKYDVIDCYLKFGRECGTPENIFLKSTQDISQTIQKVIAHYSNVRPISFNRCEKGFCPQVINEGGRDIPVVFDSNHPTAEVSRLDSVVHQPELEWLVK